MTLEEFTESIATKKEASLRISEELGKSKRTAMRARAARMAKCQSFYTGDLCPICHTWHTDQGSRCRDRLCPSCGWMQAIERAHAVSDALMELGGNIAVFHIVLTMRDGIEATGEELREEVRELIGGYARLIHMPRVKRVTWGTVRSVEISNNGNARFHPHIHALWIQKPQEGKKMLTHAELCEAWGHALGVSYTPVCWIEPIYALMEKDGEVVKYSTADTEGYEWAAVDHAIAEACKYAVKPSLYNKADTAYLEDLSEGIAGAQLFGTTGALTAAYRKAKQRQKEERTKDRDTGHCDQCGAITEHLAMNWQNGGYVI